MIYGLYPGVLLENAKADARRSSGIKATMYGKMSQTKNLKSSISKKCVDYRKNHGISKEKRAKL